MTKLAVLTGMIRREGDMKYAFVSRSLFDGCASMGEPNRRHDLGEWLSLYLPSSTERRLEGGNGYLSDTELDYISEFQQRLAQDRNQPTGFRCYRGALIVSTRHMIDMNTVKKTCTTLGWTPYAIFDAHDKTEAMSRLISHWSGVPKPAVDHILLDI